MPGAGLGKFVEHREMLCTWSGPQQVVTTLTEAGRVGVRSAAPLYSCVPVRVTYLWELQFPPLKMGIMMTLRLTE